MSLLKLRYTKNSLTFLRLQAEGVAGPGFELGAPMSNGKHTVPSSSCWAEGRRKGNLPGTAPPGPSSPSGAWRWSLHGAKGPRSGYGPCDPGPRNQGRERGRALKLEGILSLGVPLSLLGASEMPVPRACPRPTESEPWG